MSSVICKAQNGFYFSVGTGLSKTTGKLEPLQDSYDSYLVLTQNNFPNDPLNADETFSLSQWSPNWSYQFGFRGEGILFGFTYQPLKIIQTRYALRESGYGRKFNWEENRKQIMMDLGWSSKYVSIIGIFGLEIDRYTMASYQVYPDGTEDIGNEFNYNGYFRSDDVGLSIGLGMKFYPVKYICAEVRYIYTGDKLPGESNVGSDLSLTDNSSTRNPYAGTEFHANWNEPPSFQNNISANFKRTYLQFTLSFDLYIHD